MKRNRHNSYGRSLLGVVVILACMVVLGSIVFVVLWNARTANERRLRDATYIRQIHQAALLLAQEFELPYPAPGLLKRFPVAGLDRIVQGAGREDVTQNTTAHFYSMLIAQNYITPEKCIGPTEPSGRVIPCDGYDWNQYRPETGDYWDSQFAADLSRISNTSYAHLPLFPGAARIRHWGDADASTPLIGNRGPRDGVDPSSITDAIHDPPDRWLGHMCFGDNHVDMIETFTPHGADNIFAYDDGVTGDDAIISFTRTMNEDGPTLQHD